MKKQAWVGPANVLMDIRGAVLLFHMTSRHQLMFFCMEEEPWQSSLGCLAAGRALPAVL